MLLTKPSFKFVNTRIINKKNWNKEIIYFKARWSLIAFMRIASPLTIKVDLSPMQISSCRIRPANPCPNFKTSWRRASATLPSFRPWRCIMICSRATERLRCRGLTCPASWVRSRAEEELTIIMNRVGASMSQKMQGCLLIHCWSISLLRFRKPRLVDKEEIWWERNKCQSNQITLRKWAVMPTNFRRIWTPSKKTKALISTLKKGQQRVESKRRL